MVLGSKHRREFVVPQGNAKLVESGMELGRGG